MVTVVVVLMAGVGVITVGGADVDRVGPSRPLGAPREDPGKGKPPDEPPAGGTEEGSEVSASRWRATWPRAGSAQRSAYRNVCRGATPVAVRRRKAAS